MMHRACASGARRVVAWAVRAPTATVVAARGAPAARVWAAQGLAARGAVPVRVAPAVWEQVARMSTETSAEEKPAAEEEEAGEQQAESADAGAEEAAEPTAEDRIADLEAQVKDLADQRLRLLAEMENVRKIARNDVDRAKKFAAKSFAKSLLDIADNLDRAMECVPEEARGADGDRLLVTLFEGVQMTEDIMLKVFARHGIARVTQYGEIGDDFDPHVHNALFQMPNPELGPNKVAQVLKTGFMFHDMVLRPAEVGTTPPQ